MLGLGAAEKPNTMYNDSKNVRFTLKSIQSQNQELRKELQCLYKEVYSGNDERVGSKINSPEDEGETIAECASSQLVLNSLQAELDVARSLVGTRRSYHAMRQGCGVTDPSYSNALFGKELTRTYNDLVQTNNALVGSNMHVMEQQQRLSDYLQQQTIIKGSLSQWVENQQTQSSIKRQKLAEEEDSRPKLKEHLEWLRTELTYVSKIAEFNCIRSNHGNSSSLESRNESNGGGMLSQLFSDLIMKRIAASDGDQDPYIEIRHVDPSIIALLKQCGVVHCHRDDSNYVSLVDFTQ